MDPHDFVTQRGSFTSPRKILFIGTLGSGKTTLAEYLARDTGFPYASIDACRVRYSNSTVEGEDAAWDHFLEICGRPVPAILEFSGRGPRVDEVRDALYWPAIPSQTISSKPSSSGRIHPLIFQDQDALCLFHNKPEHIAGIDLHGLGNL